MKKEKSRLLDQSLAWIRTNPTATNLDVPEEFAAQWIFEDDDAEPKPAGFFFAIFAFGYMQRDLFSGILPPTTPRSVPVELLSERFQKWQLKLALTEIHRRTNIQTEPLPLFEFPDAEEVRYFPRPTDAKTGPKG